MKVGLGVAFNYYSYGWGSGKVIVWQVPFTKHRKIIMSTQRSHMQDNNKLLWFVQRWVSCFDKMIFQSGDGWFNLPSLKVLYTHCKNSTLSTSLSYTFVTSSLQEFSVCTTFFIRRWLTSQLNTRAMVTCTYERKNRYEETWIWSLML